jgi:hypothetical protein
VLTAVGLAGCTEPVTVEPDELMVSAVLTLTGPGDAVWEEALEFRQQHCCGTEPRRGTNAGAVLDVRWRLEGQPAESGPVQGSLDFFVRGPEPYGFTDHATTDTAPGVLGADGGALNDLIAQHSFLQPFEVRYPNGSSVSRSYYSVHTVERGRAVWLFEAPGCAEGCGLPPIELGHLESAAPDLTLAIGHSDGQVGHWAVEVPIAIRAARDEAN